MSRARSAAVDRRAAAIGSRRDAPRDSLSPSTRAARATAATPPPGRRGAVAVRARLRADRDALEQIRAERAALEQRMAELRGTVHDLSDEVANLDRQVDVTARGAPDARRAIGGDRR